MRFVVVLDFSVRLFSVFCLVEVLDREEVFDIIFPVSLLVVLRTVSAPMTDVVCNADKPRHTVKNCIILFIP